MLKDQKYYKQPNNINYLRLKTKTIQNLVHILEPLISYERLSTQQKIMTSQQEKPSVQKCLQSYQQTTGLKLGNKIQFFGITEEDVYDNIIEQFFKVQNDAKRLMIWKSTLAGSFFEKLGKFAINLINLYFIDCSIGNSLGSKLVQMLPFRLKQLHICTDPISNKGIKSIAKLNLKTLEFLRIVSTKVTTDFIRTIAKAIFSLKTLRCYYNVLLRQNQVFKIYQRIAGTQKNYYIRSSWKISLELGYFCFLCKLLIKDGERQVLRIKCVKDDQIGIASKLTNKMWKELGKGYKLVIIDE